MWRGGTASGRDGPGSRWIGSALLDAFVMAPVATALRQADVPYLMASAYGTAELAGFGLDSCACSVGKPAEPQRLLAALKNIARGSATVL